MAEQSINTVTVTVQRPKETRDGSGGWVEGTPTVIYQGTARMCWALLRTSEERKEAEPGISTEFRRYFIWDNPIAWQNGATGLLPQDQIVVGSDVHTVTRVWPYAMTTQCECYLMR